VKRFIRLPAVLAKTTMQKSQILKSEKEGKFPKRVTILEGGRAVAWDEEEVDAFMAARLAARDAEPRRSYSPRKSEVDVEPRRGRPPRKNA